MRIRLRPAGSMLRPCMLAAALLPLALAPHSTGATGAFALQFDGANDYVTFGVAPELGVSTFTLEVWFIWTGGGSETSTGSGGVQAMPLIAKGRGEYDGDPRDMNYLLGIRQNDRVLVADFEEAANGPNPGLNHPVIGVTPVSIDVWHHAAVTYDGTEWRLYLDGVLDRVEPVGRPPQANSIQHASLATSLDSSGNPSGFFAGVLDEARIWQGARPASQISSNRFFPIPSAPGLIGRWSLDEGSGTVAADSGDANVAGTLLNGPLWVDGYPFATAPTVLLQQPVNGAEFVAPGDILLQAAASDPDGTVASVEFRAGSSIVGLAAAEPFTATWTNPQPGQYELTAVATDNAGLAATSAPVALTVQHPVVQLIAPAHRERFLAGSSITLQATALDSNDPIVRVEFLQNAASLGAANSRPFARAWNNVPAGEYTVTAVAVTAASNQHTSAPVQIVVFTNQLPWVTLTSPIDGTTLFEPAEVTLLAEAGDTDGVVTNVQFFSGLSLLGAAVEPPYRFQWSGIAAGNYSLHAVARDEWGFAATSAPVRLDVQVSAPPTILTFTPPPGLVSNLAQITVTFSEPVDGIDAADLLVNQTPATAVTGTNAQYTFIFPPPPEGPVSVDWSPNSGILDREAPPRPFAGNGPGETAQYEQVDSVAPVMARIVPPPGAVVRALAQISVTFSEPVRGIQAHDLLVGGLPATTITGSARGPYVFSFPNQPAGNPPVAWRTGHGITDFAQSPNAFAGGQWLYTVDPNASFEGVVVLSEIMYHPASENLGEEFIELHNTTAEPVNLDGWRLTRGVDFTFTNLTLPGHGYLVVAANLDTFQAKYPGITNVVAGWTGRLNNDDEEIELEDAIGERVDRVAYADEGDWAVRQRGPYDNGANGWEWYAEHDGSARNTANNQVVSDRSLELVNPALPNNHAHNWQASLAAGGSPGQPNSRATNNTAPFILDTVHFPAIPKPADAVTVTARIIDEQPDAVVVTLHHRNHSTQSPPAFTPAPMFDDGQHNDAAAGDGIYGLVLPPQPNGTVVEFYLEATDAQGNTRTWPAPARQSNDTFTQSANALYQVDDNLAGPYSGNQPFYRLILTESERSEFERINRSSDAQMNTTFITSDGTAIKIRYQCGVRIRGSGSRGRTPPNYRLNIPTDRRWNGLEAINLNTQFIHAQLAGSALSLKSGLPAAAGRAVQVRVNGANLARAAEPIIGSSTGSGFGSYIMLEPLDGDWAGRHFPQDGDGNVYRVTSGWDGTLAYLGTNPSSYAGRYTKASNFSEYDWTDLIQLCHTLSSGLPDPVYLAAVRTNANVQMWMRYFAVCSLLVYSENGLPTGVGDDYALYRGIQDPRFLLVPHDLDTVLGEGDGSVNSWGTGASIWLAIDRGGVPFLSRFMRHNEFAPLYFREFHQLANTSFSAGQLNPLLEELFAGWLPAHVISRMQAYAAQRVDSALAQIPRRFAVTVGLPTLNGYPHTTGASATLSGSADALWTRSVHVNGSPAAWTAWQGSWTATVNLHAGLNQILIRCLDDAGAEIARTNVTIWADNEIFTSLPSNLEQSQVLTAGGGPYLLTGNTIVEAGATLTLQPGTTLFLADDATLSVYGQLLAEGTESDPISITRPPGTSGTWQSLRFFNGTGESRLLHVNLEHGGNAAQPNVLASGARLHLEHVTWANTSSSLLVLTNSSIRLLQSTLPGLPNADLVRFTGMPTGGFALIEGNTFGTSASGRDVIQFTGGQRPGPIAQFLNNTFTGSTDEILALAGADAHIEGNLFRNAHQNVPRPDAAHAITAERSHGLTSDLTVVRNFFVDCDHALLLHDGASARFHNNTVVTIRTNAAAAEPASAIRLRDPAAGLPPAAAVDLDGNIFWALDGDRLFAHASAETLITVTRSLLPGTQWPGTGNLNADPRLVDEGAVPATLADAWIRLALQPGSPAIHAGPNGLDMGACVPGGASITGEPVSPTPLTTAQLIIGGPGIEAYICQTSSGAFSPITPISTPLELANLPNGSHQIAVIGRNSAGTWQPYTNATRSRTWIVNTTTSGLRLNEVLARNDTAVPAASRFPDLVELYNSGPDPVDLTGFTLSDNRDEPAKFTFPAGATLGPDQYLALYADNESLPAGFHLGFSLKQEGDDLHLFNPSGQLFDSVVFGPQIADFSIGRQSNGQWGLTTPTFGGPNQPVNTGNPARLKINEWLAAPAAGSDDFVELYNPEPVPVRLAGLFLTDLPYHWPDRHTLPALTFIPAHGFLLLIADGRPDRGPDHLGFGLDAEQGLIGLFDPDLTLIDSVLYGPQTTGVTMGRVPNGGASVRFLETATPGSPNPLPPSPEGSQLVINEVFARNLGVTAIGMPNPLGRTPEWIELHNPTTNTLDLADLSLTDDLSLPRKYVFPQNSSLPPGGYRVILCEGDQPPSTTNAGFGIKANGDTLYLYDTPANGGSLLDSVAYGVQAKDFSIGRSPDGAAHWTLVLPTAGSANLPATLGNQAALRINEWMADPATGDDWFEIVNPSPQPVSLGDLYLTDDIGTPAERLKSPIPPLSYIGIGLYGFEVFIADGNPANGPEHVNFRLSANGEAIGLYQSSQLAIDTVTFGLQLEGVSEGRLPDAGAQIVRFPFTSSPNDANYLPLTQVVINEMLTHTDLPLEDAIELFNPSPNPVNIGGWYLSDDNRELTRFRIPDGTLLPPGGFKVFYETNFSLDPSLDSPFALNSARGETLHLSQAAAGLLTGYRATARFGAAEPGISFGRHTNSVGQVDYVALTARTFGADEPETVEAFRFGTGRPNAAPRVGPIAITEIMYHPPDFDGLDNLALEFIELHNLTTDSVPLHDPLHPINTWRLRSGVDFNFPPGLSIPGGDYLLVVSFDPALDPVTLAGFRAAYQLSTNVPMVGPYSGRLDNGGENIALYKPDSPQPAGTPDAGDVPYVLVERIEYDDAFPWPTQPNPDGGGASLQRLADSDYGNDPANWTAAAPTPGPQGLQLDYDQDGMPDTWETEYGLNSASNDAFGDLDGDGLANRDEYYAGTRPDDPQSGLRLVIHHGAATSLQFTAQPDRGYLIEFTDQLPAAWNTLASIPPQPLARTEQHTDPAPPVTRFYRLRLTHWPQ